jgi:hypothetical protein
MKNHLYNILITLFLLTLHSSCNEENTHEVNNIFQITVAGKGDDCGLLLIDFDQIDKIRIEEITQTSGWLRFFALNLNEEYNQVGKELKIKVRRTKDEEFYACTTLGPAYPWVTVLCVEE